VSLSSNLRLIGIGLGLALMGTSSGLAVAQTAELNVTAEIQASCVVNGGSLDFGIYSPTDSADTEGDGSFSYQCTNGTNITLKLDQGDQPQDGSRAMSNGSDTLSYDLFQDLGHSLPWDDGTNVVTVTGTTANLETVNVYGLIEAGQTSPAGNYSDTVTITLEIN
jgi:spore coat protein U-like protein